MLKVECSVCGRYCFKDGDSSLTDGVSHSYCARCIILSPEYNNGFNYRTASQEEVKELIDESIKPEILSGRVWQEPDLPKKIFSAEDENKFREFYQLAQSNLDRERSEAGKKR